ncbi:hypothetical protein OTU49_012754, partial [Cherax quadricarinatus]
HGSHGRLSLSVARGTQVSVDHHLVVLSNPSTLPPASPTVPSRVPASPSTRSPSRRPSRRFSSRPSSRRPPSRATQLPFHSTIRLVPSSATFCSDTRLAALYPACPWVYTALYTPKYTEEGC